MQVIKEWQAANQNINSQPGLPVVTTEGSGSGCTPAFVYTPVKSRLSALNLYGSEQLILGSPFETGRPRSSGVSVTQQGSPLHASRRQSGVPSLALDQPVLPYQKRRYSLPISVEQAVVLRPAAVAAGRCRATSAMVEDRASCEKLAHLNTTAGMVGYHQGMPMLRLNSATNSAASSKECSPKVGTGLGMWTPGDQRATQESIRESPYLAAGLAGGLASPPLSGYYIGSGTATPGSTPLTPRRAAAQVHAAVVYSSGLYSSRPSLSPRTITDEASKAAAISELPEVGKDNRAAAAGLCNGPSGDSSAEKLESCASCAPVDMVVSPRATPAGSHRPSDFSGSVVAASASDGVHTLMYGGSSSSSGPGSSQLSVPVAAMHGRKCSAVTPSLPGSSCNASSAATLGSLPAGTTAEAFIRCTDSSGGGGDSTAKGSSSRSTEEQQPAPPNSNVTSGCGAGTTGKVDAKTAHRRSSLEYLIKASRAGGGPGSPKAGRDHFWASHQHHGLAHSENLLASSEKLHKVLTPASFHAALKKHRSLDNFLKHNSSVDGERDGLLILGSNSSSRGSLDAAKPLGQPVAAGSEEGSRHVKSSSGDGTADGYVKATIKQRKQPQMR